MCHQRAKQLTLILACLYLHGVTPRVWGFEIIFDYAFDAHGFFDDPLVRSLLEDAANEYGARIMDSFDAYNGYHHIDVGSVSSARRIDSPEDGIRIYVGVDEDLIGTTTLGYGSPFYFLEENSRGEIGHSGDPALATDFVPAWGIVEFNPAPEQSGVPWFFDETLDSDDDIIGNDFYSVALHEIGHVLGFGTAPSFHGQVTNGGYFTGASVTTLAGGLVGLTADRGHWPAATYWSSLDGTNGLSLFPSLGLFDPLMTPYTRWGQREYLTDLDLAAFKDIGWEIVASNVIKDSDGDGISDALDPDDDNDGMPDAYELEYGLDPFSAIGMNGANGDADGDGASNIREMRVGTDPRDAAHVPRADIASIANLLLE